MDRTLKNAIHKAWEAAHKQGETFEPDALISFDAADEGVVKHEVRAVKRQHHTPMSPQMLGSADAPTTIEKSPESPSTVRIEKTLPQV